MPTKAILPTNIDPVNSNSINNLNNLNLPTTKMASNTLTTPNTNNSDTASLTAIPNTSSSNTTTNNNNNNNGSTTSSSHNGDTDLLERPLPTVLSCPNLVLNFPAMNFHHDKEHNNLRHLARHHHKHHLHLPPPPHSVTKPCRIGILLHQTTLFDRASRVIDHSISFCKLAALTLLHTPTDKNPNQTNTQNPIQACREWLRATEEATDGYGQHADTVQLFAGEQGLAQMLTDDSLDAVYVIVPTEHLRRYVLQCLRANKHVLIKDFRSTALTEFREQISTARAHQRFVQFSTMFDIQYNVHSFLETVNQGHRFGRIESIKADLELGDADLERVGAHRPLESSDSCIYRLARYCVLMALLMTPSEQSKPLTAQVEHCLRNDDNVMICAMGKVWFDNGRLLELQVGYSAVRTRQLLQVRAATKYAVVSDFALAGTHGMHSFRVYDYQKDEDPVTGKKSYDNVSAGEALDVPSGLPQHVMMWRGFAELCQQVQEGGWDAAHEATFLTNTAVSLKATLIALEESAAHDFQPVPVKLE